MVGCGAVIDGIQGEWPDAPNTIVVKTPEIIEKPFLTVDEDGEYSVFVPEIRKNSEGVSWDTEDIKGKTVSLEDFYVAKPLDSASKINKEIKTVKILFLHREFIM